MDKLRITMAVIGAALLLAACNKDPKVGIDYFTFVDEVSARTTSATITGTYDYPEAIRGMEVCVSEGGNAMGHYAATLDGTAFSVAITGLRSNTTYRYYYSVDDGVVEPFSTDTKTFTTLSVTNLDEMPTVRTVDVIAIDSTTCRVRIEVESDGGSPLTEQGICWNTTGNPTTDDATIPCDSVGTGIYTVYMEHLTPGKQYYVRAYAKNDMGTGLGNVLEFDFVPVPVGAIRGLFTINANGDQVFFSKGNLQYNLGTSEWRFAEHQYDILGFENNSQITYNSSTSWIDLFGWGTGDNPTNISQDTADYAVFVDWGDNAIGNGGNQSGRWHTLSSEEWAYLFEGRIDAAYKYGIANVNDIGGLVILPDNWICPSGLTFNSGFSPVEGDWSHNNYTISQWQIAEESGAVFLPAAGCREAIMGPGGSIFDSWGQNHFGVYWSFESMCNTAKYFQFDSKELNPQNSQHNSNHGLSVRLVCPARN